MLAMAQRSFRDTAVTDGRVALNIRITPEIKARLEREARRRGISQTALVAVLLDQSLPTGE